MNSNSQKTDSLISQAEMHLNVGDILSAGKTCQVILQQDPKDGRGWALWGRVTDLTGDHSSAAKWFVQAIECNSDEPVYYFWAGQQYLRMDNAPQAEPFFEKAIELKPDFAEAHQAMGKTLTYQRKYQKAEPFFREAIHLAPNNLEAYEQLADGLERMNHLNEAEDILNEGLKRAPNHVDFLLALAKLKRRDKNYDEAMAHLEKFILTYKTKPSLIPPEKLKLSIALNEKAKILEKNKQYDNAYEVFSEGQNLLTEFHQVSKKARESDETNRSGIISIGSDNIFDIHVRKSREWFNKEIIDKWPANITDGVTNPPLFLIGFPRSGTTLMGNILAAHNGVLTLQEEGLIENIMTNLNYPEWLDGLTEKEIPGLQKKYFDSAKEVLEVNDIEEKTLVDKMPLNNVYLGAIYRLFPNAKILSLLRDPRDVCLSCFVQNFNYNPATIHYNSLENTIKTYSNVMELYLFYKKILPERSVLEIKYEEIVEDLEGNSRKILDFAGLNWDPAVLEYYKEENNRYVATPSYEGVMQPIYKSSSGKWVNYKRYFIPYMEQLLPFIREFGYER